MRVPFAVLADGANISREGKLNILGIFDTIFARKFPVTHAEMKLVFRIEAAASEAGMNHRVEIKLIDEEGKALLAMKANVVPRPSPSGKTLKMDQVLSLRNVTFKKPGQYFFSVTIDDEQKAAVRLRVAELPARAVPPPGGALPPPGTAGEGPAGGVPEYH